MNHTTNKDNSGILWIIISISIYMIIFIPTYNNTLPSFKLFTRKHPIVCNICKGSGTNASQYFWLISPAPIKSKNGKYIYQNESTFEYCLPIVTQNRFCINCMGKGFVYYEQ